MSLKMQVRYQYRYFIQFLYSLALPRWVESSRVKVFVAALVVVLGVGYVFQTSAMATSGYIVHDLEREVASLESETEKIETQVASYQSMTSIQKRLVQTDYVSARPTKYLKVSTDTSVAKR